MTTKKIVIAPRTEPKTHEWYCTTFDNPNQGAQYVLEAFPELYHRALTELRGVFTRGELSLMLDVLNGTMLTPGLAGQQIAADCEDGILLENYDKKWKITDPTAFFKKLRSKSNFELAVLEIWARAFWKQKKLSSGDWIIGLVVDKK